MINTIQYSFFKKELLNLTKINSFYDNELEINDYIKDSFKKFNYTKKFFKKKL